MESARRLIQKFTFYLGNLGMFVLLPIMFLSSAEVVSRSVWNRPLPGTVELSSYMMSIFVLCGLAYTQQVKGHVRVGLLLSRLSTRAGVILESFTILLSLFMAVLITWQGVVVGLEQKTVSDMLRIPQLPFRLFVALAGAGLFLELFLDLVDVWKRWNE
ncbi:MAG: TRAP transporter small permease [Deltaproteobacteria bacterium]|nr:TRAP transporter small permease [Deltaproteobacteria bacterium]